MRNSSGEFRTMIMRKFTDDCLINVSRTLLSGSWTTRTSKHGSQRRASPICGAQARVRPSLKCHIYANWLLSWLGQNNDCVSPPGLSTISFRLTVNRTAVVDAAKYRKSTLPTATVFYYCQNEQYESLQTGAILSSFIKQLCEILRRTSNSFPEVFMRGLQKFFGNDRTVPDFEDLEDLFMQIFYHVPNTVYVVDGIDALDGENSKRLLKLIQSIFCGRKSLEGSRILLLSRDHIEGYINISTFIPGIQHISTSTNIMGDIKKFIEMTIIDKTMHRKLTEDQGLLEELKSILLTESVGMYASRFHIPYSSSSCSLMHWLYIGFSGCIFNWKSFGVGASQTQRFD